MQLGNSLVLKQYRKSWNNWTVCSGIQNPRLGRGEGGGGEKTRQKHTVKLRLWFWEMSWEPLDDTVSVEQQDQIRSMAGWEGSCG